MFKALTVMVKAFFKNLSYLKYKILPIVNKKSFLLMYNNYKEGDDFI